MFGNLFSYFEPSLNHTNKKSSNCVYRDELDKKATTSKLRRRTYYKTHEAKSPLLKKEAVELKEKKVAEDEKKVVCKEKKELRVKVRMTKEEAVRLLSKCKEGGLLEFSDVAHELNKIPKNRVRIVDFPSKEADQVLDSIPE